MNKKYGKLIDGVLEFAPTNLIIDDMQVINAEETDYINAGYLVIEYTSKPDEREWQAVYTEVDGVILQSWVYEGRIHDHSNLSLLEDVTEKSLSGAPAVHILPANAKDGDLCLYAPMNTITLADSGKRIYFDWEEFVKPIESEGDAGVAFLAFNYNSEINFEVNCFRNANGSAMSVIIAEDNVVTMLGIEFEGGNLVAAMMTISKPNDEYEEYHYNSIDELPLYVNIPKGLTQLADMNTNTAEDNFMFCTEYRLMKYQGGEWVEAVESGVTQADMETYVTAAINGSLGEVETMIDEIETLINESGVLDDES